MKMKEIMSNFDRVALGGTHLELVGRRGNK